MVIDSVIAPGRVLCNVEARSKKHSLDIISELLANADPALDHDTVFESMIGREKLGCTAIDTGVAIPHGCVEGIDQPYAAFVRLRNAVDYDTTESAPVDLIFGVIFPAGDDECHREELVEIASAFRDRGLLRLLRTSTSSRSLHDMLTQYSSEQPASA